MRLQAARVLGPELLARVDPSDVVQEALTQVSLQLDSFQGDNEAQWVAWLRALVAGHAAKARRFHHAEKRDVARELTVDHIAAEYNDAQPDAGLMQHERAARVAASIETLSETMQAVVIARMFQGSSWDEVAKNLGKTPVACRVTWVRALRKLRDELGPMDS